MPDKEHEEALAAHLAPDNQRLLLHLAGLYLVGYELVKQNVITGVRDFFLVGFNEDGYTYDPGWDQVKASHKHELQACLNWLVDHAAITAQDAEAVTALRNGRNDLAHELPRILVDPELHLDPTTLVSAFEVLRKIAVFFGSMDVDADPQFDGTDVDYDGIQSLASLLFGTLLNDFASVAEQIEGYDDSGEWRTSDTKNRSL